jgi:cytidylate kinase
VNAKIRTISQSYSVVIDGRDIGTIVFPKTPYKFYLDAKPIVRAKRRAIDLNIAQEGEEFEELLRSINQRDKYDMEREIAPLKIADDAVHIDTSDLSIQQVMAVILGDFERIKQSEKVF